jgi:hypothetical protein
MLARMHELLEASDQSVKVVRDIAARPQQPPPPQTPGRSDEPVQEQQERPLSESERKRAVTFWNERRRLDREMEVSTITGILVSRSIRISSYFAEFSGPTSVRLAVGRRPTSAPAEWPPLRDVHQNSEQICRGRHFLPGNRNSWF